MRARTSCAIKDQRCPSKKKTVESSATSWHPLPLATASQLRSRLFMYPDDFDRSQFDVTLSLYGVRVPKQDVANLATRLRRCNALFDRPRLRSVVECDSDEVRLVLLREECGAGACCEV